MTISPTTLAAVALQARGYDIPTIARMIPADLDASIPDEVDTDDLLCGLLRLSGPEISVARRSVIDKPSPAIMLRMRVNAARSASSYRSVPSGGKTAHGTTVAEDDLTGTRTAVYHEAANTPDSAMSNDDDIVPRRTTLYPSLPSSMGETPYLTTKRYDAVRADADKGSEWVPPRASPQTNDSADFAAIEAAEVERLIALDIGADRETNGSFEIEPLIALDIDADVQADESIEVEPHVVPDIDAVVRAHDSNDVTSSEPYAEADDVTAPSYRVVPWTLFPSHGTITRIEAQLFVNPPRSNKPLYQAKLLVQTCALDRMEHRMGAVVLCPFVKPSAARPIMKRMLQRGTMTRECCEILTEVSRSLAVDHYISFLRRRRDQTATQQTNMSCLICRTPISPS